MKENTTLTIKNAYREISIEIQGSDQDVYEMVEDLFKPALLALGYQPGSIKEVFGE